MMISDIITKYIQYIDTQNEINKQKRYVGFESWLHASGTGCHLKHLFAIAGIKPYNQSLDMGKMLMRLGTIVHTDIQEALNPIDWKTETSIFEKHPDNKEPILTYEGNTLLIEKEIRLPMFNVRGFLDLAEINHKEKIAHVADIKTAASYKWSFVFGRKTEAKPSTMYQIQLATYALGLAQEYPDHELQMSLLYYKKDNSDFRQKFVGTEFLVHAAEYWSLVNEFVDENTEIVKQLDIDAQHKYELDGNDIMAKEGFKRGVRQFCNPGQQIDLPVASFECNPLYCDYCTLCPSLLHSSKKK